MKGRSPAASYRCPACALSGMLLVTCDGAPHLSDSLLLHLSTSLRDVASGRSNICTVLLDSMEAAGDCGIGSCRYMYVCKLQSLAGP